MRRITLSLIPLFALATACSDDTNGNGGDDIDASMTADGGVTDAVGNMPDAMPPDAFVPQFQDCSADDASFVRNAYLAVLGYRPRSSAEVKVYTDIIAQVRALAEAGENVPAPERVVIRALTDQPEFVDRWSTHVMDALKVQRIEDQTMESCYNNAHRELDSGELAQFVRDNMGTSGGDGLGTFTMLDLLRSSLVLDDLSPVYRAHLYTLVSRAIPAANVPAVQAELARREDFGLTFDASYLNRDIVCLGCHNSQSSVTYTPDPETNRHWAIPGFFEKSLYGISTGIEPERAHAPFRYTGFVADPNLNNPTFKRPWDWSSSCGVFAPFGGVFDDPAGIDGLFGSLSGTRLTVYDLEAALSNGFDRLAQNGLEIVGNGDISEPDTAFGYLVAAAIVESVWREVIGSPLTIANYFARNQESMELLKRLTDNFIANGFSLKELLYDILTSNYFNRSAPEDGCGPDAYNMPPVYDPWVIGDSDPDKRLNSSADGVAQLSARTLMRTAYMALSWNPPRFQAFPELPREYQGCSSLSCNGMLAQCQNDNECCFTHDLACANPPAPEEPTSSEERTFQREIGVFLKNGERGFRGLDFQARLAWEDRFGMCTNVSAQPDFIEVLTGFVQFQNIAVEEVVLAIKDRIVNEPFIDDVAAPGSVSEREALEALLGVSLDTSVGLIADLDTKMRTICGVLVASPQFLLSGIAPRGGPIPTLTLTGSSFGTICQDLESRGLADGLGLTCESDTLTVEPSSP